MLDKTKILFLIIVVLVVGGLAFLFLNINKPDSPKANPIFGQLPPPNFKEAINVRGKIAKVDLKTEEKLPALLAVYKLEKRNLTKEEAKALAKDFRFESSPQGDKALLWRENNKSLTIELSPPLLEFTDFNVHEEGNISNQEDLVDKAETFLQSVGLYKDDLTVDGNNTRSYNAKEKELTLAASLDQGSILEVGFNKTIDSLPVMCLEPTEPAAIVLLNAEGSVFKLIYRNFATHGKGALYPTISRKDITRSKVANFGSLVYPRSSDTFFDPSVLKDIVIEDYSLGYLDDQSSEFLLPILILRGFGKAGEETPKVVIYLPAVSSGWLE